MVSRSHLITFQVGKISIRQNGAGNGVVVKVVEEIIKTLLTSPSKD